MKHWHPRDWKNPHALKKGEIGITDPFTPRVLLKNAYEAGATAMLEALKTKDNYLECEDSFHDVCGRVVSSKKLKGWLVFIPEEGK